jgi:outer membrane protein TolC
MAMSAAPVLAGCAVLPGYLPPPAVNYFFGATHDYDLNASPDAHLVHVLIRSAGGDLRELYMPGGPRAGTLPAPSFSFSYGRTTWEIFEMRTTTETFEGFVRQGAFLEESLRGRVQALSRAEDAFSG